MYTCVRYNRSCDGRGGKLGRNRCRATTGTPNSAAAASEVESVRRPGGAKRRPDAEEADLVVGGVVGGRLKVT